MKTRYYYYYVVPVGNKTIEVSNSNSEIQFESRVPFPRIISAVSDGVTSR